MRRYLLKILLLTSLFATFVGCRPRNVLSSREMRELLYDLHRVDGAMQILGYNYGHDQELSAYYKAVLDKHGITQAQFDSSLVWYTDNPQIFNKIYPVVLERLQADLDYEEALRDERLENIRREKGLVDQATDDDKDIPSLRPMDDVQQEYMYGIENPWKIWEPKEFCEKNVIIFGQLEKKL